MGRTAHVLAFIGLAACADWPDVPAPDGAEAARGWPALLPISELLTRAGPDAGPDEQTEDLAARAEALRRRAALLRTPVADDDAFEALRSRLSD